MKIVIIEFDMKRGPKNIAQFPPEEDFPPKELILKMWARHEMEAPRNFIVIKQDASQQATQNMYCSVIKKQVITNHQFLIILEIPHEEDISIYEDILTNISDEIIDNLNSPQFSRIIAEAYRVIKDYSNLDEDQLFLELFKDRTRVKVFSILRQGPIAKYRLKTTLERKWGYKDVRIDLLLIPFIRLGLIQIHKIPGIEDCIFLLQDVYCCLLPPKNQPTNLKVLKRYETLFTEPMVLTDQDTQELIQMFQKPGVKELCSLLKADVANGMPYDVGLTVVKEDIDLLQEIADLGFIIIDKQQQIYLVCEKAFVRFKPTYLYPILANRHETGEISVEQMIQQIQLLE